MLLFFSASITATFFFPNKQVVLTEKCSMTTTYSVQIQAVAIKQLHIIKMSEVGETLQTKTVP